MVSTAILSYATASTAQGKFIQFTLRGREYLVFAPRELHQFHNQILAHFLADRNIPHRWIDDQTLDIQASDFSIMGGGKFRVNTKAKILKLWDNFQAYGRFDERGLTEKIATAGHSWSGFDTRIS